ncbi:MAG TPA: serine/threonine protein kinase [bacterium]|nr:serine/threonine protein kinase [bacterium]
MSENIPHAEPEDFDRDADEASSAADRRMAELLREQGGGRDLRRELQGEDSEEASDILSRLNALDFVQQVVVGEHGAVPERIGGYQIKGVLGRGGMGVVYLGWQQELEREVALKVLSQHYTADPTMRKRFRAEARATAALHHRHIVPIYDYGESQGMLFFAMERVDGMSLDKHIAAARRVDRAALPPLEAARRFAGVADALGLAHRRRLLHRDVKPGNILVGDDGTLALTDFGLAKALDHASMQLTSKDGGFLGTLHYASPEQALGGELTPASDLYSLGVTMFEAVTGSLPRSGKTTEALLQSILHGTPSRLRDCLPKPPRDLEAVLDKLLAREPGDRYQDGEALARDLQRIADGEPVHIRRLPLHVRLWRRARKNPVLTGALVAVAMLVLATATLVGVLTREKGRGLLSRHQNRLVAIAQDVGRERGSPWGPPPLLQALTGVEVPELPVGDEILRAFDEAHAEMPDDPAVQAMRRAYEEDPVPNASAFLAAGRGFEAMLLYDEAIRAAADRRTGGSLAVELGLYRLYLARGVARLTAAVARPNDARTDLALASYLRPGAVFPMALLDLLDVVQSPNVVGAVERLRRELSRASAERVRAVALLLWAAAGHAPPMQANLMSFALAFDDRRAMQRLAGDLLTEPPSGCVASGEPTGLGRRFAEACRKALEQLADPDRLRSIVERTSKVIVASAHPESPLQGWRHVLQLLTQPRERGPLLGDDGEPLPAAMQLAAWRALVQLQPRGSLLRLWLVRFEEFRRDHPGQAGVVEVAARMHLLAGSPAAEQWANRWVAQANGDPAAHLCRMQARLGAGRVLAAQDDAIVAVQASIDPERTLRRVVQTLVAASRSAEPGVLEQMQLMADRFREQLEIGVRHLGGGR